MLRYALLLAALWAVEAAYVHTARRLTPARRPVTGAGVVFVAAAWLGFAIFGVWEWWYLAGVTLIGAVSFLDDMYDLPIWQRLVVQTVAVVLMYQQLHLMSWPLWWLLPAMVVAVGFINAYNFMDGIDGITGMYTLAVMLPLWYINHYEVRCFISSVFMLSIALAAVVFLCYNLGWARRGGVYCGDVGSITIGTIVAYVVTSLVLITHQPEWLLLIAVYGADTVMTLARRISMGHNLGTKHHLHIYQQLTAHGTPHWRVALGYSLLQLAITAGLIALPTGIARQAYAIAVVVALGAAYCITLKRLN